MSRFLRPFLTTLHPSWCLYASFVGVIIGIVLSQIWGFVFCDHYLWLVAGILLIFICLHLPYRITLILALIAGCLIGNFRVSFELAGRTECVALVGETITLTGKITEDPEISGGQTKLRLGRLKLSLTPVENPVEISGTAYIQLSNVHGELERSDIITLEGKLDEGFGTFVATMYRPKLTSIIRSETGDIFARLKNWFAGLVQTYIPEPESALGLGYLLGQKSGLPEDLSDKLRAVGMTHVVVASGAHLGILIGVARKLFGKISRFAGILGAMLFMLIFVAMIGGTPSMTRAALVTGLSLVLGYFGRKFTPGRLLIFVAMITLLIAPANYLNLGWQLSFASFFGILILAPSLVRIFYGGKCPAWLPSMLITSVSTTLVCAPVLIYNFGSLSLLALIANLVVLPTLPYAMLLVFLTGASSFWPLIATWCGRCAAWLLDVHLWLVDFLSAKTTFILNLPSNHALVFLLYLGVAAILIAPKLRCLHRRINMV